MKDVAWVACEDTRVTRKLLTHLESDAKTISVREANEAAGAERIIGLLGEGQDVAYCSDAGTPGISDPGRILVERVREAGHAVSVIPGPSAISAAIALSGIDCAEFHFAGFLPSKSAARRKEFMRLREIPSALVFYEAPHRMDEFLKDAREILGERRVAVCREISKRYEETIVGSLLQIAAREWRGEITIVMERGSVAHTVDAEEIDAWIVQRLAEASVSDVAHEASIKFGIPKRDAYKRALAVR